ncbi:hypothetical protein DFH28DRAFT_170349 [Melampsora americana]|nr:hypothetical protein DFH28DRAFT_170349 [Melampsora americana]
MLLTQFIFKSIRNHLLPQIFHLYQPNSHWSSSIIYSFLGNIYFTWTLSPKMHSLPNLSHTFITISIILRCSMAMNIFNPGEDMIKASRLGKQANEGASGTSGLQQGRQFSRGPGKRPFNDHDDIVLPASEANLRSGLSQNSAIKPSDPTSGSSSKFDFSQYRQAPVNDDVGKSTQQSYVLPTPDVSRPYALPTPGGKIGAGKQRVSLPGRKTSNPVGSTKGKTIRL